MIVFLKIFKYRTSVPSYYFKEQSSKRKFEEKKIGGGGSRMGKLVFDLVKGKQNFYLLSLHF